MDLSFQPARFHSGVIIGSLGAPFVRNAVEMRARDDPKFPTLFEGCTFWVAERPNTLPLQILGGQGVSGTDRIFDLVLPLPILVRMPPPSYGTRRPVEHVAVVEYEAVTEKFAEELHHLRVGGGDIPDEVVVSNREMFRHDSLRRVPACHQR